jgi:serine/threonine protein kinase
LKAHLEKGCPSLLNRLPNRLPNRDMQPANIFLCKNDVVKIGDLGVAKALERLDFAQTQVTESMGPEATTTGVSLHFFRV